MRINWSGIVPLLVLSSTVLPVGLVRAQTVPADYLPTTLSLPHADCFEIDGDGVLDFSGLLDRFANVPDAATVLHELGWEAGPYRQFGCDSPPAGSAGWIDIGVHLFADAVGATAAAPFLAESKALETSLQPVPGVTALTGSVSNGTEYTPYVIYRQMLFRVTGAIPRAPLPCPSGTGHPWGGTAETAAPRRAGTSKVQHFDPVGPVSGNLPARAWC